MKAGIETHIDAAHKLERAHCSKALNEKIYGKCNRLHGHRWKIQLEIEGEPDKNGWIIDFRLLKEKLLWVVDTLDHQVINDFIPLPTAENMVIYITKELKKILKQHFRVTVYETETSWASIRDCEVE